ncbi:uncharacterized protein LOC134252942 [Saccostrea cucullata]|uniref:uncharacterized protein LOC134252942 n=1 Tax=Saccostrea cuccullata TaxID=36930 RepID=UPI002ED1CE38
MTKDTFKIARDDVGRQYVYQSIDELDKNHRADAAGSVTDGRMYELPGNKNCPVFSFQKYLSKLNPNKSDLWQRPRDSFDPDADVWYVNASVGKNSLASFMSDISNVGKLSKIYRNHSVRATSITVLDVAGISGRHIMKVSGHKSETSLKSYSHFISDGKKREISETLSAALGHQHTTQENVIPETVTENLSDLASVFAEDFELNPLDNVQSNVELSNVLLEIDQRKLVSQNQLDVSSRGPGWFRPNFSGNCRVQININYHK